MATTKAPNSKPPRGIQVVQWTNSDGSTTTKYRVRISRKDYQGKKNNYFDNLKEATSFLSLSKLEKGKELIYSISEEERQRARKEAIEEKEGKDFTFEYVARRWLEVVKKYRLNGSDIVKTLLTNRKISFKEVSEITPIVLVKMAVTKDKKGSTTGEKVEGFFEYFEGKRIISDQAQAKATCLNGVDSFKNYLTETGKEYLANAETKSIIVDFYNEYKAPNAQKWDGQ